MKVTLSPQIKPRRGCEVKLGSVYQNPHGRPFYKLVVGLVDRTARNRPWNNVILLHIDAKGNIVGSTWISKREIIIFRYSVIVRIGKENTP